MGDSVGVALGQGDDEGTSTLGPCLLIQGQAYWLLNLHPLWQALRASERNSQLVLEHPSPDDSFFCGHNHLESSVQLGDVVATSEKYTRTRKSADPYWENLMMEPPEIIMDWALCATTHPTMNFARALCEQHLVKQKEVLSTAHPATEAPIYSCGRTSGFQRGQTCMFPELVSRHITHAAEDTLEWFVEESVSSGDSTNFAESGIGVPGDSGAAIIDEESNALIGQLWGRNKYKKQEDGPRITFFTPIHDIFNDIQERCSLPAHPRLPQRYDEPQFPSDKIACLECSAYREEKLFADLPPEMNIDERTPPEDEILTPEDVGSPDIRRESILCRSELLAHDTELYGANNEVTKEEFEKESDSLIKLDGRYSGNSTLKRPAVDHAKPECGRKRPSWEVDERVLRQG